MSAGWFVLIVFIAAFIMTLIRYYINYMEYHEEIKTKPGKETKAIKEDMGKEI